jgi:hypothetical protein
MGTEAIRLLKFLIKYPGWNSYGKERKTVTAVGRLEGLGFIEVDRTTRQMRLDIHPASEHLYIERFKTNG